MSYGRKLACWLICGLVFPAWLPSAVAQGKGGSSKVSQADVDAAGAKSKSAADAANAAQKTAEDAAKKAADAQAELDKMKAEQQAALEKQDAEAKVKRLEAEIKAAEEKLKIADKTEQKVVNNITNPTNPQTPLTPEEDRLRREALGGDSVPVVPKEIHDSFDAEVKRLKDEIDRKKKELGEEKNNNPVNPKASPDQESELAQQNAAREAAIKAKEAEVEAARKAAEQARQEQEAATAAAAAAKAEFDAKQAQLARQKAIEEARKQLIEAQKELQRLKDALDKKQADLNRNSWFAKFFADLFRLLSQLNELLNELTGEDADPTGALEKGARILDEIDKLLNDPNSNWQWLKDLLSDNEIKLLQNAITRLRNAQRHLLDLLQQQAAAATQGDTNTPRRNIVEKYSFPRSSFNDRATLLKSPSAVLEHPAAIQLYAALERAVATGNLDDVQGIAEINFSSVNIVDFIDDDDNMSHVQTVTQLAGQVAQTVAAMQQRAIDVRDNIQSVGGDASRLAGVLQPPAGSFTGNESSGAEFAGLSDEFQSTLYRSFQSEIARALAESAGGAEQPSSGVSVVKGNARFTAGKHIPAVTLTLSTPPETGTPDSPNAQSPASEQSVAVRPDANGDFEVTVPAGTSISRLQIGGPDLASQILIASTPTKNSPAWLDPRLDDAARQATNQRFRAMDVLLESAIAGIPDHPSAAPLQAPVVRELLAQLQSPRSAESSSALGPQTPYFEAYIGLESADRSMSTLVAEAMSPTGGSGQNSGNQNPVAANVTPVTKGDVNGDGMLDIITSVNGSPGGTFWLSVEDYLKIGDVKSRTNSPDGAPFTERIQSFSSSGHGSGGNDRPMESLSQIRIPPNAGGSSEIPVDSLPQRLAVVSNLDVANDSNPGPQEIEELQRQTLQTLQPILNQVVSAGSSVDLQSSSTTVDRSGSQSVPGQSPNATASHLVTMEFTYRATDANGQPVSIDPNQLQSALDQHPTLGGTAGVALPRDAQATPDDPHFSATGSWGETYADQWALKRAGFAATDAGQPSAWPTEPNSLVPCVVAVIGSGVDWTHPELLGQMWMNTGEDPWNGRDDDGNGFIDDQFGWNFRENNNDVLDTGGHDTHIAGVIAARTHNAYGISSANPAARIMALKAANYLGQADAVSIAHAIRYAVNNGARVINISYGGDRSSPLETLAIEYAASHGVLVIAAAGNQGVDAQNYAIASSPLALTVAGSTTQDERAGFSNWGQPVDLTAPAMDVLSLRARGTDFLLYTGDNPNYTGGAAIVGTQRDLYRASGTSFAAPLVSGAASLLFSRRPELTAMQVRNMLLMSAEDIDVPGFDQNTGAGILNAARSIAANPDQLLLPQIAGVALARRDGATVVEVSGKCESSGPYDRWLQIAFGESPERDAWTTVAHTRPVGSEDGVLGTIPAAQFNKAGVWSIRVLVQDESKVIRQSRATLTTQ